MSDNSKLVTANADKILRSRMSGEKWAEAAIPSLCSVSTTIKIEDAERKKAAAPHKEKMVKAEAPFKEVLKELKDRDTALRARVLDEYPLSEGITVPGAGGLSFVEQWVFEIPDPSKVDEDYCDAVNESKITEAITDGARKIKGVKIYMDRILRVTPEKG